MTTVTIAVRAEVGDVTATLRCLPEQAEAIAAVLRRALRLVGNASTIIGARVLQQPIVKRILLFDALPERAVQRRSDADAVPPLARW